MIEEVSKRDRRRKRQAAQLADFEHTVKHLGKTYDALRWIRGLYATWKAVRLIASSLVAFPVEDVPVAWAIIRFVHGLPDGEERLARAFDDALEHWRWEVAQ